MQFPLGALAVITAVAAALVVLTGLGKGGKMIRAFTAVVNFLRHAVALPVSVAGHVVGFVASAFHAVAAAVKPAQTSAAPVTPVSPPAAK